MWLLRQLQDAKASLQSSHIQSMLRLLKNHPNRGKIELSNAFFSKCLHRTSEERWKKVLKITFCICFKNCSGLNDSSLEIDEVILGEKRVLRDFSPSVCVLSRNLEILTSVNETLNVAPG